jgi:putative ABC transport system permease protein
MIIDGYALKQFEGENHETIKLGDKMFAGLRKMEVTAITKPVRSYASHPKVYMIANHIPAIESRPYFIIVKVMPTAHREQVAYAIQRMTGYDALTSAQFVERALKYFREKTPIIIIFISVAILGFMIGLAIMWQIFSNFILTHMHQFGMLKMLGVSNGSIVRMVLFQASIVGGLGYVIGLVLAILFGLIFADTNIAFHLTWQIVLLGALGTMVIIILSSYFSILKILRMDTVDLCRDTN